MQKTVENYWTLPFPQYDITDPLRCAERRVRIWLNLYAQLEVACYLSCSVDALDRQTPTYSSSIGATPWAELMCIKADLDMAIKTLPHRSIVVVKLRYRHGYFEQDIATMMRCSQSTISRILSRACINIARRLVVSYDDDERSEGRVASDL